MTTLLIQYNQHPTRPVENVALTAKDLQKRKTTIEWDDGVKIDNKKSIHKYDTLNHQETQ